MALEVRIQPLYAEQEETILCTFQQTHYYFVFGLTIHDVEPKTSTFFRHNDLILLTRHVAHLNLY